VPAGKTRRFWEGPIGIDAVTKAKRCKKYCRDGGRDREERSIDQNWGTAKVGRGAWLQYNRERTRESIRRRRLGA